MKILVIQTTQSGVYYHRQWSPHYTWLDSGPEFYDDGVVIVENHHLHKLRDVLDNNHFDVIQFSIGQVSPQNMTIVGDDGKKHDMIDFLRWREKNSGMKTALVLDIDDRYGKIRKDVYKSISRMDAITTTCPNLVDFYAPCGKPTYIIENGVDSKEAQWQIKPPRDGQLMFGYLGSTKHERDLQEMRYDFSSRNLFAVCQEYADILKVDELGMLGHWKDYAFHYDKVHVSLAPLENTPFNKAKSNLKIIEAGFKKKALIATKIPPYTLDESLFPAIDLIPKKKSWKERIESYTKEGKSCIS